jgi:hypothetical protein
MKIFLYLCGLGLAVADISLQTFTDDTCGGEGGSVLQDVHAQGNNVVDSSQCQAQGQFHSANAVTVDPGFVCNIYSDAACANFVGTIADQGCTGTIGSAVICFNNAAFSNPFVESTAVVTLGTTAIQFFGGDTLQNQLNNAVSQACPSSGGCDPTKTLVLSTTIQPSNVACNEGLQAIDPKACSSEDCTSTIALSGNFDNSNQRDYMKGLMQGALNSAPSPVSFLQVDINDKNGDNQASLKAVITSQCTAVPPPGAIDCSDTFKDGVSGALSLVPDVGGLLALAFQIFCDANE